MSQCFGGWYSTEALLLELNFNSTHLFGSSQDLTNDSVSIYILHFSTLGAGLLVPGCKIPTTEISAQDLFPSAFLASQLVKDMHSNGNTMPSAVGLSITLLPWFSYILKAAMLTTIPPTNVSFWKS